MRFGQGADCAAVAMLVNEALRALMGLLWGVDSRKELAFIPFSQVGEYRVRVRLSADSRKELAFIPFRQVGESSLILCDTRSSLILCDLTFMLLLSSVY